MPCAARVSALVGTLHLNVVLPALCITHENIEDDGTPEDIWHILLRVHFKDNELRVVQDDPQNPFHAGRAVLQTGMEERVVHETELCNVIEHLFSLLFLHTTVRPLPLLPILQGIAAGIKKNRERATFLLYRNDDDSYS